MSPWSARSLRRGFTLLEVLVTITIFALLFAVMMAGWYQALQAQTRLSAAAQQVQQQQQLSFALRQLLAEALSPATGQGVAFNGDRKGFTTESTTSLAPGLGDAPVPVSLQIESVDNALALRISHPGQTAQRFPWRLTVAEISYLDSSGNPHDKWPPDLPLGSVHNDATGGLPALVQLTLQFDGQARPTTLLAAPRASGWQPAEPNGLFGATMTGTP